MIPGLSRTFKDRGREKHVFLDILLYTGTKNIKQKEQSCEYMSMFKVFQENTK